MLSLLSIVSVSFFVPWRGCAPFREGARICAAMQVLRLDALRPDQKDKQYSGTKADCDREIHKGFLSAAPGCVTVNS